MLMLNRYSIAVIGGPTVGPLIGSAITESYLGVSAGRRGSDGKR